MLIKVLPLVYNSDKRIIVRKIKPLQLPLTSGNVQFLPAYRFTILFKGYAWALNFICHTTKFHNHWLASNQVTLLVGSAKILSFFFHSTAIYIAKLIQTTDLSVYGFEVFCQVF